MVFHEFMHGIKDSSETFLQMFESAKKARIQRKRGRASPLF